MMLSFSSDEHKRSLELENEIEHLPIFYEHKLSEKLTAELLQHARKELRRISSLTEACREEWAVSFARKEAVSMPDWKGYLKEMSLVLDLALEEPYFFLQHSNGL